ncbi:QcrA and Rieske domain-containing protein [Planktothrix mougeotii]|uniref:Ubiquinol-cytochrome c reductase iron-sulfur subunit n=1 Tax=Planktothrix mougeotii LEGE 06226 TaxID=1828728 RepID=A0ABR9UA08_9CYAN|nr:ubiquinol-cytochrome c reductase iron-sulfur subunit [Planktothrix mougeotii]MBE9143288.1 ubiquinol-cytochrome c reductase iron-sulfur subunit [Planktothrix mougeotii LEGE 06226]
MNRRQFFNRLSLGTLATSIPIIIGACSQFLTSSKSPTQIPQSNSEPISNTPTDGFIKVGTVEELAQSGQILDLKHQLIVIRNPNTEKLAAFNVNCPHQGCSVGWEPTSKTIICPCHGSQFNSEGGIIQGPTVKPLKAYPARIENQTIFVKLG